VDAFETVVAAILERQGFWTQTSVKVELTKAEKRRIKRPSSPRWELDIVAYRGATNELRVVECKSYLDSPGVEVRAFEGRNDAARSRYKLFFDATLRRVVLGRLEKQLVGQGFVRARPKVQLCLAAGRIRGDERRLQEHFDRKGWLLMTPALLKEQLETLSDTGYQNDVAAVVTKLLRRGNNDSEWRAMGQLLAVGRRLGNARDPE
jgi:hypothetical protein